MMALFGVEEWCERGEIFSVYFGMFSRLARSGSRTAGWAGAAPFGDDHVGDGSRLGGRRDRLDRLDQLRRRPGGGLQERASNSTFELARRTRPRAWPPALRLTDTIFMLLTFAGVGLVYLLGVRGMRTVRGAPPLKKLRSGFAHTLIPIAFAYLVAHYFSLFVFQEQAQFTYLLSDPLGTATTNLFGTASGGIDFTRRSAPTRSGTSRSARWSSATSSASPSPTIGPSSTGGDYRLAARSQYWMLAVMVAFTCFGLYLLSVGNG